MPLPHSPIPIPAPITTLLQQLGVAWATLLERPRIDPTVAAHWDDLIYEWANTDDLPLFIRKGKYPRGSPRCHTSTKRVLTRCDNSPAQWAFTLAFDKQKPNISEIREYIERTSIPLAMILTTEEREITSLGCGLTPDFNMNSRSWKLGHIRPVGLRQRMQIEEFPISTLREHFIKLMSPSNMFAVPLEIGAIAELSPVIQAIAANNP